MLAHRWGYQFGILHHRCFIELCTHHQGSAVSFGVPEATVSIFETLNIAVAFCLGWF